MVSVFVAPHIGQVIVELGVTRISQAKTNPSAERPEAQSPRNHGSKQGSTAHRTRSARRGRAATPEQHPTSDQADHSSGQELGAMWSGKEREAAEPRAPDAERAD